MVQWWIQCQMPSWCLCQQLLTLQLQPMSLSSNQRQWPPHFQQSCPPLPQFLLQSQSRRPPPGVRPPLLQPAAAAVHRVAQPQMGVSVLTGTPAGPPLPSSNRAATAEAEAEAEVSVVPAGRLRGATGAYLIATDMPGASQQSVEIASAFCLAELPVRGLYLLPNLACFGLGQSSF